MISTRALNLAMANLLAADTATLGAVAVLKLKLVTSAFTPGPNLTLGALTFAAFTGGAPIDADAAPQNVVTDPITGLIGILINEPAGGWVWICTVAPGSPETCRGVALVDNAENVLYGSQLLPEEVTIAAVGDAVIFANAPFWLVNQPFSPAQ